MKLPHTPNAARRSARLLSCALLMLCLAALPSIRAQDKAPSTMLDTAGFRDGAHHWRHIRDDKRVIQAEPEQPSYAADQVDEIVGNILHFQRANGGWPKDYDMLAVLTPAQREAVRATHARTDTSYDNHNIHSQVRYLAAAAALRNEPTWREACLRGFDFMLASQLDCGGFPQRFPYSEGYGGYITFNDGVMIGILDTLQDAASGAPAWRWLDDARRARARAAVERGVACILKCQIRVDGTATGWCQQHDPQTWAAACARTFELASICPQETTEIARFLMRFEQPSAAVAGAIDAAVAWLRQAQLAGIRVERVAAPAEEFLRHRADFDVMVRPDERAPPVWARHYEIGTDRPVFAGRDGIKRYALADIERERRTGTPWYGAWPQRLLERDYPAWQARQDAVR